MAVEVAGTSLHWSQPLLPPYSSLSHKTRAVAFSINAPGGSITYHIGHKSCFLGTVVFGRSHQRGRAGERRSRARACSSDILDGFGFVDDGKNNEDEFVKRINNFAPKFKVEAESRMNHDADTSNSGSESSPSSSPVSGPMCPSLFSITSEIRSMWPDPGPSCDGFAPDKVDLRVNCFDLPLSLRILKRKKKQWDSANMVDSAYSLKKAFSSMVFIVRELQSHIIRMREALFSFSNLQMQGILARVHDELHASFVWLFQSIFSTTPTLMIYLMLLLANFTIFSITDYPANAKPPPPSISATIEESRNPSTRLDSCAVKSFSVGRSAAVGGSGGSGGGKKAQLVAGAADDGRCDRSSSSLHNGGTIFPDLVPTDSAREQDEEKAWKGILEEVQRIRASGRHEVLMDPDTLRRFVSPVTVELEPDDLSAHAVTELFYRRAIAEGLDDPLILSNFAQFLYVVVGDHDRAEEYFKRAASADPADAEALSRYANFLWVARKDLEAAEETFLEAIETDPGNSYHSANYAHFLWSTGGEDTCYPLDACDS